MPNPFLSTNQADVLTARYARKGIVIDTNILLLFLVGYIDPGKIEEFKLTCKYTKDEFLLLSRLVKGFEKIIITPQILAEVTNHLDNSKIGDEHVAKSIRAVLYGAGTKEKYFKKDDLIDNGFLSKFGFTDVSVLESAKNGKALVLTDDLKLTGLLRNMECDVLNATDLKN